MDFSKNDRVKPEAFDHKSKMRLLEHGDIWIVVGETVRHEGIVKSILLRSETTNYHKWWKLEFIHGIEKTESEN